MKSTMVLLLLALAVVARDDQETRQAAEELLKLMNVERNLSEIRSQIQSQIVEMTKPQMKAMNVPDSLKDMESQHSNG